MTCNLCGVHEATIHLTEIVNNQMVEVHLCESCAQEKGTDFKTHFNFGDLFAGLSDMEKVLKGGERRLAGRCSQCGLTYEDFGKTGRLGCSGCYESFNKLLMPMVKRIQRSTQHIGKRPSRLPVSERASTDLRKLQDRLRKSIQMEAFEEAARIRDEIEHLQEKMRKSRKDKS